MKNHSKPLLTMRELSDYLGISYDATLMLVRKPGFPKIKIGKRTYVPVTALEQWLKSFYHNPSQETVYESYQNGRR